MKLILAIFILLPLAVLVGPPEPFSVGGDGITPSAKVLSGEEELVYEVKWTFVKLGTIRLRAHADYSAEAYIDSYDGLPYVDLHSVHFTQMDSAFFSRSARSIEMKEKDWQGSNYRIDQVNRRVFVEEIRQQDPSKPWSVLSTKDTLRVPASSFLDGLSIAYRPRALAHTSAAVEIPTILYGKLGSTFFYYPGEHTTVDLDVVDHPVRAIKVEGTTTVEGIFGMTGDFKGWFSDDDAAVPLKGRLQVMLGSVNVELIRWQRKGWSPPA